MAATRYRLVARNIMRSLKPRLELPSSSQLLTSHRAFHYSGHNMKEARSSRISMSNSSGFSFFWYWKPPDTSSA